MSSRVTHVDYISNTKFNILFFLFCLFSLKNFTNATIMNLRIHWYTYIQYNKSVYTSLQKSFCVHHMQISICHLIITRSVHLLMPTKQFKKIAKKQIMNRINAVTAVWWKEKCEIQFREFLSLHLQLICNRDQVTIYIHTHNLGLF